MEKAAGNITTTGNKVVLDFGGDTVHLKKCDVRNIVMSRPVRIYITGGRVLECGPRGITMAGASFTWDALGAAATQK